MASVAVPTAAAAEDLKSEDTGLGYSLATTAVGATLIAAGATFSGTGTAPELGAGMLVAGSVGFLVGPTLGHIYAGDAWNAGLAIRLGGLTLASAAAMIAVRDHHGPIPGGRGTVFTATAAGLLLFTGTLVEVSTVPSAVRSANARLSVAPVATTSGMTPGAFLVGEF